MEIMHNFPKPAIKVNATPVAENKTYLVKSEVTAIIDVSKAFSLVQDIRSQNDWQRRSFQTFKEWRK